MLLPIVLSNQKILALKKGGVRRKKESGQLKNKSVNLFFSILARMPNH